MIITNIKGNYEYEKQYLSLWNLADKASTIPQKSDYINKFVQSLERSGLNGEYNAVFLKTLDNSFDKNLEAIKSLQKRLVEIQGMDVTSFAYQTAIQQITQQEQGEAHNMLSVFKGVWWKSNHPFLWDWIGTINIILLLVMFFFGIRYSLYGKWNEIL
jgi:uncharacterized protein YqgV (UPF0045/DUF77 family)